MRLRSALKHTGSERVKGPPGPRGLRGGRITPVLPPVNFIFRRRRTRCASSDLLSFRSWSSPPSPAQTPGAAAPEGGLPGVPGQLARETPGRSEPPGAARPGMVSAPGPGGGPCQRCRAEPRLGRHGIESYLRNEWDVRADSGTAQRPRRRRGGTSCAIELVQQVCRIPSVLGEEGELAGFLQSVMAESGFEAAAMQPVLPGRPNALGELSFGPGPRVVLTGHMDTKPVSHGWTATMPFSGELIYGQRLRSRHHGHEGRTGLPDRRHGGAAGQRRGAGGHGGHGRGRRPHGRPARLHRLLRQLPGRHGGARRAVRQRDLPRPPRPPLLRRDRPGQVGAHLPRAARCQRQRAGRARYPRTRGLAPHPRAQRLGATICSARRPSWSRAGLRRPAAGRPVNDPGRVRDPVDCRPQPCVTVGMSGPRSTAAWTGPGSATRGSGPRSSWPTSRTATWRARTTRWSGRCVTRCAGRAGRAAGPARGRAGAKAAGWLVTRRVSARRCRPSSSGPAASRSTARTST